MTTLEKIGWMAVTIGLIIAVTAAIVVPIYGKAEEQGQELKDIKFETTYHEEYRLPELELIEGVYYAYNRTA